MFQCGVGFCDLGTFRFTLIRNSLGQVESWNIEDCTIEIGTLKMKY